MIDTNNMLSQRYYHELDSRDRIFSRLQLNFAIYASVIALLAYMLRMIDYSSSCVAITLFFVGLSAGAGLLAWSIYYTIAALTGHEYKTLPKSDELIRYEDELKKHAESLKEYNLKYKQKAEVPDPHAARSKYMSEAFSKCIDHNYAINEFRRQAVRKSIWSMVKASIPVILSAFLFVIYDLDASSPRKVSVSFNEGNPLINAIDSVQRSISVISTAALEKEGAAMSNEEDCPNNAQQPHVTPPPPSEPKKPELQVSTEDFKAPLPNKAQILNEDKK